MRCRLPFARCCLAAICLWLVAVPAYTQLRKPGDLGPRDRSLAFGFQLNTQGLGIEFVHMRRLSRDRKWQLGGSIEITSLVDLREQRINSLYADQRGKAFINDKTNWIYLMDFCFGGQRQVFRQTEFSRLSIHVGLFMGPTLAILRPYVIYKTVPIPGTGLVDIVAEQYKGQDYVDIYGEGDFFSGFDMLSARGGFKMKTYVLFNIADRTFNIKAVRLGVNMHLFGNRLPIMYNSKGNTPNSIFYIQGSLTFLIGGGWNRYERVRIQDRPEDEPQPEGPAIY
jgi:hypothetical protein